MAPDLLGDDFEESDAYGSWAPPTPEQAADERCFGAAEASMLAWLSLPKARRESPCDPSAGALLDAAFGLLSLPGSKAELAQAGALASISRDDAKALAGFVALGARFEPAKKPAPRPATGSQGADEAGAFLYEDAWKSSPLHLCASSMSLGCLDYFLAEGCAERDAPVAAALLREPEPSALRQIDRAFLEARDADLGRDPAKEQLLGDARELILALMGAASSHSEELGLSIATGELLRGNPLFVVLHRALRDEQFDKRLAGADGDRVRESCLAMAGRGLLDPALPSHRRALIGLASEGSETACLLALQAGLSPDSAGSPPEREFLRRICLGKGLDALGPHARNLCRAWAASEGFGQRLFDSAAGAALGELDAARSRLPGKDARDDWDAIHRLAELRGLCEALASDPPKLPRPSDESILSLAGQLDPLLLESPPPVSKRVAEELRLAAEAVSRAVRPSASCPRL